jgi:hypothetical protein
MVSELLRDLLCQGETEQAADISSIPHPMNHIRNILFLLRRNDDPILFCHLSRILSGQNQARFSLYRVVPPPRLSGSNAFSFGCVANQ